jgi:hypothetical protein
MKIDGVDGILRRRAKKARDNEQRQQGKKHPHPQTILQKHTILGLARLGIPIINPQRMHFPEFTEELPRMHPLRSRKAIL